MPGCGKYNVLPGISVEDAFQKALMEDSKVSILSGYVKTVITSKTKGRYALKHRFLLEKPDRLLLQTVGLFGVPLVVTGIDKGKFDIFIPMLNQIISGEIADLGVTPDILSGLFDFSSSSEPKLADETGKYYVFAFEDEDGSVIQKIWVEKKRLIFMKSEQYDEQGDILLRIERKKIEKINGVYQPLKIYISDIRNKTDIMLAFRDIRVNDNIFDEKAFTIKTNSQTKHIINIKDLLNKSK